MFYPLEMPLFLIDYSSKKPYFCFHIITIMEHIEWNKWQKAIKNDKEGFIIDVRSPDEYSENHIAGAKCFNVQNPPEFMEKINPLDKTKNYYLYCHSGNRSKQACMVMEFNGFKNVFGLKGGIENREIQ